MKSVKFFRTIWRINGVTILLATLAIVGLVATFAAQSFVHNEWQGNAVNTNPVAAAKAQWKFGDFVRVQGTRYIIAPVESDQEPSKGSYDSYSREAHATRNYLFVNADDQTSHYLLPTHDKMILELRYLNQGDGTDPAKPVQWILCRIVDADTNKDKRLTEEDEFRVAFADPDGKNLVSVIPHVSAVQGVARLDGETMLLFYKSGDKSLVSKINIAGRRVISTKTLPALPQSEERVELPL